MHSYVSEQELREIYTNLPLLRPTIEHIDPKTTVVMCRAEDINAAIEHYGKYCSSLPEFYIINWEKYVNNNKHKDIVIKDFKYLKECNKYKCLYIYPLEYPWNAYTPSIELLTQNNIQDYFVDAISDTKFTWIHSVSLDKEVIDTNWDIITKLYNTLEDSLSKYTYIASIKMRETRNIAYLPLSNYRDYHHPNVPFCQGDIVIDGGIGRHLAPTFGFSSLVGKNGKIFSFEPAHEDYINAQQAFASYPNIELFEKGIWSSTGTMTFIDSRDDNGHIASVLQEDSHLSIETIDIDSFLEERNSPCHFIKLDIEGAELEALYGATKTLKRWRPKLAVCIYHKPFDQIYTIFDYIQSLDLDYRFFVGQHSPYYCETVLYAISNKGLNDNCTNSDKLRTMLF